MKRYFYTIPHQGKEKKYVDSLLYAGFRQQDSPSTNVKFVLMDFDIKGRGNKLAYWSKKYGIQRYFVYPHAGRPNVVNDIYPAWEGTTCQFVATDGHMEIMRAYGYTKPLFSVGWHLCDIVPFQKTELRNVLFAPIHPRMSAIDLETNAMAFDILQKLAYRGKINLTVRYINCLELSGLPVEEYPWITYVEGKQNGSTDMIDDADLVVSHQTFAYLAIARGKPTIQFREDIPPKDFDRHGNIYYVNNWDKYKHLLMYPLDLLSPDVDPYELMLEACATDDRIRNWRSRLIGTKMFDREEFLHQVRMRT